MTRLTARSVAGQILGFASAHDGVRPDDIRPP